MFFVDGKRHRSVERKRRRSSITREVRGQVAGPVEEEKAACTPNGGDVPDDVHAAFFAKRRAIAGDDGGGTIP
eukprot:CAMPEP_0197419808 /NCGR_PEP_ID=MMETSP1170-20131217/5318_1 /TAXON_ID=54406 /ORGANISM="Sarcinochrysis sp, Strain CCMP770" /LENGTH=72 /DNA_ID=CAMNT_0042946923 /DNA_START=57 /DNA_END=271 /DNA_ORIENTATION=+